MTSSDVQVVNEAVDSIKLYINGQIVDLYRNVNNSLSELKTEISINAVRIEEVKNSMSLNFTVLAIVVAFVGFVITLAPMFREMYRDAKRARTREDVREIVREEVQAAISQTLKQN